MTIENASGAPVEIHQQVPNSRVFHILGPAAQNVTLTGGGASTPLIVTGGSVRGGNGGGILDESAGSTLTLTDVRVTGNSVTQTGNQSKLTGGLGGGVYSLGSVTLNASTVGGDSAETGGGGIAVNRGVVTLAGGSSVSGNQSPIGSGGGIAVSYGSVFVTGSHVDGNSALDVGGIMVGTVIPSLGHLAVSVTGGSTVNGNSSSGGEHQNPKNLGGGGIAVVADGDVSIDASQVSYNQTKGMYSGGIVVGLGSIDVTNGSQIDWNSNNGPGGGIAANFRGVVTVSGGSQVDYNTGAAIGGGIVNFSGPLGRVAISGGSQVNDNSLTNGETIGRVIAVFLAVIFQKTSFHDFAVAAGGEGGAAMLDGLAQLDQASQQSAASIREAVRQISHPLGVLVAGGGIGVLAAPVSVTEGSQVSHNLAGRNILDGHQRLFSLAGGIFQVLGTVTIDQGHIDDNRSRFGDGGGVWLGSGSLNVSSGSTISGNSANGDGGGIWSDGVLNILFSTVSHNRADGDGGGLFNADDGQATIQGSNFQGNRATYGGGMANEGDLTVRQSTVADNTATKQGGGIFWDGGDLILIDVTFANNSPDNVFRA
jgi:hypothetical protein